jgi:hypothetical protein
MCRSLTRDVRSPSANVRITQAGYCSALRPPSVPSRLGAGVEKAL